MNLPVMELARPAARRAGAAYREPRGGDPRDHVMRQIYAELARGRPLLRLGEAMVAGGTVRATRHDTEYRRDEQRHVGVTRIYALPALAIARVGREAVFTRGVGRDGGCLFREAPRRRSSTAIELPPGTFSARHRSRAEVQEERSWAPTWSAIVPIVPPRLRDGDDCYVLWEAEWSNRAPGDPALLRRIAGDLYAVLAVWDLTPLERAVLEATAG